MRNRFKGLDLIDRVPDELWMEIHDIVQEKKKKNKKFQNSFKDSSGSFFHPDPILLPPFFPEGTNILKLIFIIPVHIFTHLENMYVRVIFFN